MAATHRVLLGYISERSSTFLAQDEISLIESVFVPRKFKKRQYFLQQGEVCNRGGFIVRGAMRQYSVDEKGAEHIAELMVENWWIGDVVSMFTGAPSSFYIDAWEDTDVLVASVEDFARMRSIPAFAQMAKSMIEGHTVAIHHRAHDALTLSAEQRYEKLLQTHPEFLQRFPQHFVASYLGVTPETISRIRRLATRR